MNKDATITFRLPKTTLEALKDAAKAERRSNSNLALAIVSEWLEEKGYLAKSGAGAKRKGRA
jgi:hypothetical protein